MQVEAHHGLFESGDLAQNLDRTARSAKTLPYFILTRRRRFFNYPATPAKHRTLEPSHDGNLPADLSFLQTPSFTQ